MDNMETIKTVLNNIRPEIDFEQFSDFIQHGILDSFDLVTLISELDQEFSISIDGTDIIPENFKNLQTIKKLIEKYQVNV